MPTIQAMNQVTYELGEVFIKFSKAHDIYLSPAVIEVPCRRDFNIQICDGGVQYEDFEGGVRREFFTLIIGILKSFPVDAAGKNHRSLSHETESIFAIKETIIDTLDGSFLVPTTGDSYLVRPLRVVAESRIYQGRHLKGLLIKELSFLGGINVLRD